LNHVHDLIIVTGMRALTTVQTPYEQHRDYVLSVLDRRCRWLDRADREGLFHDAYALLLEKERSGELRLDEMHPHQVRAYLVQTSLYKALDEGKRAERKRTAPMGDDALTTPDERTPLEEALATNLDGARVREIVDELPERSRAIIKLRYFLDCAPNEVQALLGIGERIYRRDLERAMRHIAERYELVRDGSFCDSRRSLLMAYVMGVAGPNRARQAQAHLDTCPGCRLWAVQLRDAAREVAAVLPFPVLADHDSAIRLVELPLVVKERLADLLSGAKQHATAIAARVDSGTAGMSASLRPGPVAAAVVGCIAIGGGATYCAVEGLPGPVRSLLVQERPAPRHEAARRPQRQPARTVATAPAPRASAPRTGTQSRTTPKATAPKQTAPSAADREFGLEGSGASTQSSGAGPAAVAPAPAPAPAGEFDP
jgi:RNA polymerase sigma factor (sigma-70 family)